MAKSALDPLTTELVLIARRADDQYTLEELAPLASMKHLTKLSLMSQPIAELPPLPPSLEQISFGSMPALVSIDSLSGCPRLRKLQLWSSNSELDLSRAYAVLGELPELVEIEVENGYELPATIARLQSLAAIQLRNTTTSYTHLGTLPALRKVTILSNGRPPETSLAPLVHVTSLTLGTKLETLPPSLWSLTGLEELGLAQNKLKELPDEIGDLTKLRSLDLGSGRLRELPEALRRCTALEHLSLWGCPLNVVPPWIAELTKLSSLELGMAKLKKLPGSLSSLPALRTLSLPEHVTDIPPLTLVDYRGPKTSAVTILDVPLEDDQVTLRDADRIPSDLGQPISLAIRVPLATPLRQLEKLKRLQVLDVSSADLALVVPYASQIATLTKFSASAKTIPPAIAELSSLTDLELFEFEALPSLAKLTRLERVRLSGKLRDTTALDGLPLRSLVLRTPKLESFTARLPELQRLEIHEASAKLVVESHLPKLRELDLSRVQVKDLSWLPGELEVLELGWLDRIPARLAALAKLKQLTVFSDQLPDLTGCTNLVRVTTSRSLGTPQFKARLPKGSWRKLPNTGTMTHAHYERTK